MMDFLFKHDHKDKIEENFRQPIRLMADLDKDLENVIMTCERSATYLSKRVHLTRICK